MTNGDVVIRVTVTGATAAFALSCAPGPDQFTCHTRAEATRTAQDFAHHAKVDVWLVDAAGAALIVARFRGWCGTTSQPRADPPRQ